MTKIKNHSNYYTVIGKNLRNIRLEYNFLITDICDLTGIDALIYFRYEDGMRIPKHHLDLLLDIYDCDKLILPTLKECNIFWKMGTKIGSDETMRVKIEDGKKTVEVL